MCRDTLERLVLIGRRHVADLIVLTFVLTTIMERLPAWGQIGVLFLVMSALSQLGGAIARGEAVSRFEESPVRRQVLSLGILVLLVHFTGGAIEGVQGSARGETLTWASAGSSIYSMGMLALLQWVLPFVYALALLRWTWPEIFRGGRLKTRGCDRKRDE